MNISMRFDIDAGRYEDQGEKNYKYCDSANTIAEALAKWRACEGYDFAEMELVVECDGAQSRIAIFGGQDNETWMRMRIAGLWMKATQQSFADIAAPWEEQLDEIESETSCLRKHNGALRQQNERAHKRVEELEQQVAHDKELKGNQQRAINALRERNDVQYDKIKQLGEDLTNANYTLKHLEKRFRAQAKTPWQDIHTQFMARQITWTQSFDALMSQCGMPMEEALSCLAENFNRRPAAIATEV